MPMKLLKYILPIIAAVITFTGDTDMGNYTVPENIESEISCNYNVEAITECVDSPATGREMYLPRRSSCTGNRRLQNQTKKTNSANRHYIMLACANCTVPATHNISIHKEPLKRDFRFIKPAHNFISLGKLVI